MAPTPYIKREDDHSVVVMPSTTTTSGGYTMSLPIIATSYMPCFNDYAPPGPRKKDSTHVPFYKGLPKYRRR